MTELKPCPFCGSTRLIIERDYPQSNMDDGIDPNTYYTPCENAMYRIYEHLGFNRYDIVREAYKRLTEEAER